MQTSVNLPSKPSKQYREELRNIIIQIMENNNIRPYDADLMNREPVHTSQMVQIIEYANSQRRQMNKITTS